MKELVAQLTGAAFLSLLADALLPEGSFQKYARMVSGLIVLMVLFNALSGEYDFLQFSWEMVPATLETEAAEKERSANLAVEYRRRLEEEITLMTGKKAHVELDENLGVLSVTLEGTPDEQEREKIAKEYAVEIENVRGVTP